MKNYCFPFLALAIALPLPGLLGEENKLPPANYGIESARASIAQMVVPPGLSVALFAAEPMVENPTSFDIDSKGRVWITEAANYRKYANPPIRPEGDRIMVLEDRKGTGEADKATVFYQDPSVNSALGIAVLGGDVIVSVSPNIFILRDTDGDGKADQRFLLLTSFSGKQHDHSLHSFVHGTDGKLYFNFGNACKEIRKPTGKLLKIALHGLIPEEEIRANSEPILDLVGNPIEGARKPYQQGMVIRADYSAGGLSHFEVLGNNFRNNYEAAPDSFGNVWQSDNDDDGNRGVRINYVMEHGNYGYSDELTGSAWQIKRPNIEKEIPLRHWHQNDPGVVPNLLQTGAGSPTGILVNEGAALGPVFANQLIHCDAGPRIVRAYVTKKFGAGFSAESVDILSSTDNWFRPSDVALHPDGSLFVADWYDAGVGGHGMADNVEPFLRGRIYRVSSKGAPLRVPAWDAGTPEGAIAGLKSPNKATQFEAYQALSAMGEKALPGLQALAKGGEARMRARAFSLLARNPKTAIAALAMALQDADPDIVVTGIRLGTMLSGSGELGNSALVELSKFEGGLISHKDPQVRRQLAVSLHRSSGTALMWARLAGQHEGRDRWYLEALGIGAAGSDEECLEAWLAEVGGNWNTPGGRDILWRLRTPKVAPYLAKLLIAGPGELRYMRAFDFIPDSKERTAALLLLARENPSTEILTQALQRLARTAAKESAEFKEVLESALLRNRGKAGYVDLVAATGLGGRSSELLKTAFALGTAPEALEAVQLLVREAAGVATIRESLSGGGASEREALVGMLGSLGQGAGLALLEGEITGSPSAEGRTQAIRALARSQPGATRLLALGKQGKFPPELKGVAASALALVQYTALESEIAEHFPASGALGGAPLPSIPELVKSKGNAVQGQAVFERASSSCVLCHRIGEKGVDFGPGLSGIGAKLPKEAIFEAILLPNASLSMGFETSEARIRGGGTALGIVRSETEDDLVLALPGGALQKLSKTEVQKVTKLTTSMMPSGLHQMLSKQDLVDLVEYLSEQRAVK
jgi:putative membrane-bound dehydrogenase-like protein